MSKNDIKAAEHTLSNYQESDYIIPSFKFKDGNTLGNLKIHYRTSGSLRKDSNGRALNAVLLLHGTTSSGAQWLTDDTAGQLFGNGQALDTFKYFIIIPDSIGHGQSSKPSHGLRSDFPKYRYNHMVQAQYQLVTEHLQVNHLRLVLGTSMGGMHTWMWATTHPTFTDACCAIACSPTQIGGRNRAWRKAAIESITSDPNYADGKYTEQPRGLGLAVRVVQLMTNSPLRWQLDGPESSDAVTSTYLQSQLARQDANDFVYAFAASADYDPRPKLKEVQAKFMAVNFEDDQVNPPQLGIVEREIQKVRRGKFVLVPASEETKGHMTLGLARFWEMYVREVLEDEVC